MTEIKQGNLASLLLNLRDQILKQADYYAISLDIDAIDPKDAPAVGVPETGGIRGIKLCTALKQFNNDALLLGVEIAEFSPDFDQNAKTLHLISELVIALYGSSKQHTI